MASRNMSDQGAMRRGRRRKERPFFTPFRGSEATGKKADRRRLDIALAARDLSGKAQRRHSLEPQRGVEQFGRIEESVAVQPAEPREFGMFEARDGPENADLLVVPKLG